MGVTRNRGVNYEKFIEHFQGKTRKLETFERCSFVLAVFVFLGSVFCCFCEEVAMVSVPLGFEISGFDRSRIWVSQNGVFAFGFLENCSKEDEVDSFLVGIRYNLGDNEVVNVPVWTVGGGLRVSMNSTIRLSRDGRLILVDNPSGVIVWSSDTSSLGIRKASLLNNGNLVLVGIEDNVLWQSFNSPTSTLLPGQSLHFPQTLRAPSKKSISSYYSFVIRHSGELALVWENNVTYWSNHVNLLGSFKEAIFDGNGLLGLIDISNKTVWSISSKDFDEPSLTLRRLKMDSDGNLRIYSWNHVLHEWKVGWQAVENQCDVFGSCGLYSLCGLNSTGAVCDCLYQDSVNWGSGLSTVDSGSSGCKKMVDLGNCKMNTSMMVMRQTFLYGLYPPQDVDIMLSEKACKEYCSNDTNCIAATSKNDGSGICTIKRTSFITGYGNPSVSATSFLKVCLVPLAVSARGTNPDVTAKPISTSREGDSKNFTAAIALIVSVTASGFVAIEMFVFWFMYRRRKLKAHIRIPFGKDAQMNAHYNSLIRLSFEEIKEITSDLAIKLGPSVYKGALPNNTPVIVKALYDVTANEKEFRVAVSTLGRMHHRNLVLLKGFCFEANNRFLMYEYVQNGSLDKWLLNMEPDHNEGTWQQRLDIALGVARALAYLQSECQICVPHGNLKLENVLLDENFIPKLTDFGLGSLFKEEASSSSESPSERDIYMFGEMLLQIVTCKRDILGENLNHLVEKMSEELNSEDSIISEEVERVVRIALWCMQNQPFLRPSIGEVVKVLEGTLSVDRPPSAFAFRPVQMDGRVLTEVEVDSS